MTLNDFVNMCISDGEKGTMVYVEELSEDYMDGSGFNREYIFDYCCIVFRSPQVCNCVLKERLAQAEVKYFQAVNTDEIWVQVLPKGK